MSSGSVAEFGDELEVDLLAVGFAPIGGVVELVAEGSAVIFAGGEVGSSELTGLEGSGWRPA